MKIRDCHERVSCATAAEAMAYKDWFKRNMSRLPIRSFRCNRCHRYHFAGSHAMAAKAQKFLTEVRCVTDRELHIQLARVNGISLDELQTRLDLSKIKITGTACEFVTLKPKVTDHD